MLNVEPNTNQFLSTPSARRATRQLLEGHVHDRISIHALREEGDPRRPIKKIIHKNFYPRPPRGGRPSESICFSLIAEFLSTPSARRATVTNQDIAVTEDDFYPRPPRGGRPAPVYHPTYSPSISIHALREEGDWHPRPGRLRRGDFYPRPPRGGRPVGHPCDHQPGPISIHALREEGDSPQPTLRR